MKTKTRKGWAALARLALGASVAVAAVALLLDGLSEADWRPVALGWCAGYVVVQLIYRLRGDG